MGAEAVAGALAREAGARGIDLDLVRTGSRGMYWLEPLVEVDTAAGRIGYGPVRVTDVPDILAAVLRDGSHRLNLGRVESVPYFARQERLNFARVGLIDPISLDAYRATGGFRGLIQALGKSGMEIVKDVTDSGLRGRGGAAFPTGIKWKT